MRKNKIAVAALVFGAAMTCGAQAQETATAIFAGGCFWTVESDFDHAPGVISTTSGYIGGHVPNPTYEQVVTETTGHREAVRIEYDPKVTSYEKLLDAYWHLIDPIEDEGQFCDFGESYTTAIYTGSPEELKAAEASKTAIAEVLGKPIATVIAPAAEFYPAEDYHQNFWQGNDVFNAGYTRADWYKRYRTGCGKNGQVEAIWGNEAFKGLDGHM